MAYKCLTACYGDRLYEEGVVYDSIGKMPEKFFQDIDADVDEVVSTGGTDERGEVKRKLDELGVEYNSRLGLDKLKDILEEAQKAAITV